MFSGRRCNSCMANPSALLDVIWRKEKCRLVARHVVCGLLLWPFRRLCRGSHACMHACKGAGLHAWSPSGPSGFITEVCASIGCVRAYWHACVHAGSEAQAPLFPSRDPFRMADLAFRIAVRLSESPRFGPHPNLVDSITRKWKDWPIWALRRPGTLSDMHSLAIMHQIFTIFCD